MPAFVSKQLILSDMKTYDFLSREVWSDVVYTSPAVNVFSLHSEGLLCSSGYDVPGAGYDEENDLGVI